MPTSIGERLRQAREAQNLTLEDIAARIYINPRYLKAMEAGNFAALPSRAQRRGFLRLYADTLGLDGEALLSEMENVLTPEASPPPPQENALSEVAPSPQVDSPPEAAAEIYREIGQQLQERRTMLSLSLSLIEERIHVREHYLQAMEEGRFEALPSPVQARGMLKLYAEFIGLDADALLLRFADALQATLSAHHPQVHSDTPKAEQVRPNRWRFFTDWVAVLLVGGLLIAFIVWALGQVASERAIHTPVPTPPEIAEVLLVSPTPKASPTPTAIPTEQGEQPALAPTPTPTEAFVQPAAGLNVNIVIQQRTWLKVTTDGKLAFEGRVLPGSAYQFSADERIELVAGNAAGVQVFFSGRDIGALGLTGEAVVRVFTREGVATPTPRVTNTPTPTVTGTPNATATPTPTP